MKTNVCIPALWIHLQTHPRPSAPRPPLGSGARPCVCVGAPNSILGYLSAAVFFFSARSKFSPASVRRVSEGRRGRAAGAAAAAAATRLARG